MNDLAEIDGRLRDGLLFCKKAYDIFDIIRGGRDGISKLRLRKDKYIKKFIEEVLPIARYVQVRYSYGHRIKVKWINGNQNYDACVYLSGARVINDNIVRKQYLEVTTAIYNNSHLFREYINTQGYAFGIKGIDYDKMKKQIISKPYVQVNTEMQDDFVKIILDRICDKSEKIYPLNTKLLIHCMFDGVCLDCEWLYIINKVKESMVNVNHKFNEIVLFDSNMMHFTSI